MFTVKEHGSNTSAVYRFKLPSNREALVQTKSKMFLGTPTTSFIMSTHSVVKDCTENAEGASTNDLFSSLILPNTQPASSNRSDTFG